MQDEDLPRQVEPDLGFCGESANLSRQVAVVARGSISWSFRKVYNEPEVLSLQSQPFVSRGLENKFSNLLMFIHYCSEMGDPLTLFSDLLRKYIVTNCFHLPSMPYSSKILYRTLLKK